MGFGLLFIGYFIAFFMSFNNYRFAFEIVGYAIMVSATGKLSEYKHSLSTSGVALLLMALCSTYEGFRTLNETMSLEFPIFGGGISFAVSILKSASILLFHFLLLTSLRDIAKDAEEHGIAKRSYLALVLAAISCVLDLSVLITGNLLGTDLGVVRILTLIATLVRILYPFALLAFVYSCYARICAPEDVDMPQRPSRFAFVNRWREKREQKAEETRRWREEYQQNLNEKKNSAGGGKKKK